MNENLNMNTMFTESAISTATDKKRRYQTR
jgi:hypothetical protein